MPLAFQSLNHGEIAFGFFNIETDMILLNRYFLFASDFCEGVSGLAAVGEGPLETSWKVYILDDKDTGNLMGAMAGIDLGGFIGDTYRLFPFPGDQKVFKENPEGYKTRDVIEKAIRQYAASSQIPVSGDAAGTTISIGDYAFTRHWFHRLLEYIWIGGYPRWKDGVKPPYVLAMKDGVERSSHPLFKLIQFI